MSLTRGDLLTKTRKLVKGLAKAKPVWLKAMEEYVILILGLYFIFGFLCTSSFFNDFKKKFSLVNESPILVKGLCFV